MRKTYPCASVILLLFIMLSACSSRHSFFNESSSPRHFDVLKASSELMRSRPEEALTCLDSVKTCQNLDTWSLLDQHEFMVLLTEAQFKNRCLTQDSYDLTTTVDFLDSLALIYPDDSELAFLHAKSCYYLAMEKLLQDQDIEAVSLLVTSLRSMESHEWGDEYAPNRFIALINTRLGEIMGSYNIQSSALKAFSMAQDYFNKVSDTAGIAAMLRNIGELYQGNKDYEKALSFFHEAEEIGPIGNQINCHCIGGLFFDHHQYDSACVYLEQSFLQGGPYARIDAAAKLSEIYRQRGDADRESYYTSFYVQNSIREANRASAKMEIEFLYGGLDAEHTPEPPSPKPIQWIPLLIACMLIVMICLVFVIVRNRRRIKHIENHLSDIQESQTEDKTQEIHTQPTAEEDQLPHVSIDTDEALNQYLQSDVCKKIHQAIDGKDIMIKSVTLYPKLKLSEMEFIQVVQAMNRHFPDFSTRILKNIHGLSSSDVRHCCLALMGFNDVQIAVLEGISYSGANRRTNRILGLMQSDLGLEETLILYLKKLYN